LPASLQTASSTGGATPRAELLRWNAGWFLGMALGGAALLLGTRYVPHAVLRALGVAMIPAAGAALLAWRDSPLGRDALLAAWALAGAIACGMTGGVAGPLGVWLAAPMMAAIVLGGPRRLALGAALSLIAAAVTALAQADGLVEPRAAGPAAVGLGLIGTLSLSMGLAAALLAAQRRSVRLGEAQAEAAERLRRMLQRQPLVVFTLDDAGLVGEAFGAAGAPVPTAARLRSDGLWAMVETADHPALEAALAHAASTGRATLGFRTPLDRRAWLSIDIQRLTADRLIAVLRDATAERSREAALDQARADAEALNLGKSRFLANMSHELRTPLNAIMGFSDVMRQRIFGALPGRYSEYADLIHDAGSHLLDLINDVLDMSKIEAARYELSLQQLDAREPVQAALRLLRLQADDVGVQLRGVLPMAPLMIEADQRALKQITLNLVSNALKFTPKGGQVTVSLRGASGAMELTVSDTGLGIAADDLERLGRPFEQAGDLEQQTRGTGLGLSLVRAFAELHGGEMVIESRLGEGTAVTVRLPWSRSDDDEADSASEAEQVPAPALADNVVAFSPQR
jgi:two-component system, cell cycle sensor histidine kinase DivJ